MDIREMVQRHRCARPRCRLALPTQYLAGVTTVVQCQPQQDLWEGLTGAECWDVFNQSGFAISVTPAVLGWSRAGAVAPTY